MIHKLSRFGTSSFVSGTALLFLFFSNTLLIGQTAGAQTDSEFPIELTVLFDGQNIPIEKTVGGELRATRSPHVGERVTFKLRNKTNFRLAAVLAINARNTMGGKILEKIGDQDKNRKWVLEPNTTYLIKGIYSDSLVELTPIFGITKEQSKNTIASNPNHQYLGIIHLAAYKEVFSGGVANEENAKDPIAARERGLAFGDGNLKEQIDKLTEKPLGRRKLLEVMSIRYYQQK